MTYGGGKVYVRIMKKNSFISIALAAVLFISSPAQAVVALDPVDLNIANIEQETNYWCWVTLPLQLLSRSYIGKGLSQCSLVNTANFKLGVGVGVDCCLTPENKACSRMGNREEIMGLVTHYGGQIENVPVPKTAEEVYQILRSGRYLLVGFERMPGLNHIYLVRGMFWENGVTMLHVNDPATAATQVIPFNQAHPTWAEVLVAN